MKIYTKMGDDGETGLFHGPRVSKDDARIEAYGTVDELSALLGVARATTGMPTELDDVLRRIQHDLFGLGAELATPRPEDHGTQFEAEARIAWIEQQIDRFEASLPELTTFILPGGTMAAARLHHARVVCRRAERRVVTFAQTDDGPHTSIAYLNRVSDILFVLARFANHSAGHEDVPWRRESI